MTKIVCTLGPANSSLEKIRGLIDCGMNIARLNFSHGNHDDHAQTIANLRQVSAEANKRIAILQDLSGPKLRLGKFGEGAILLEKDANFTFTTEQVIGDRSIVSVNTPELIAGLKPQDRILLGDGIVELQVLSATLTTAYCRIIIGGRVASNQGISAPGVDIKLRVPTQKDLDDLGFGIMHGVDLVAQSFLRTAEEVERLRAAVRNYNGNVQIIAKIEKREAIANLDSILEVVDGVMVARGDLGLELGLSQVPYAQKEIIHKARLGGKPVITATQMLESMIENPRPTRAEASDVFNAVFDGTDAVMLSGETAVGKYPVEACRTLCEIARAAEEKIDYAERFKATSLKRGDSVPDAIAHAACQCALDLNAAAIICCTRSGQTANLVARFRPEATIAVVSPNESTLKQSLVLWGTVPIKIDSLPDTDTLVIEAKKAVLKSGIAKPGERVIIVAGVPASKPGTTNTMKADVL